LNPAVIIWMLRLLTFTRSLWAARGRRYRPGTLILETEFETETGRAAVVDFMPPLDGTNLVRIVSGRAGQVRFPNFRRLRNNRK